MQPISRIRSVLQSLAIGVALLLIGILPLVGAERSILKEKLTFQAIEADGTERTVPVTGLPFKEAREVFCPGYKNDTDWWRIRLSANLNQGVKKGEFLQMRWWVRSTAGLGQVIIRVQTMDSPWVNAVDESHDFGDVWKENVFTMAVVESLPKERAYLVLAFNRTRPQTLQFGPLSLIVSAKASNNHTSPKPGKAPKVKPAPVAKP